MRPAADQFNSIHDKLMAKWQDLKAYLPGGVVHFVHADDLEDVMTVSYLRDTAQSAGLQTVGLLAKDLGWNGAAPSSK
ncbi:MAG TPA: glutathionylspermidine synthase family protein [Terriglobales bacterium]|nr:glutathionylspermidine synthase family protein [Terriglobales bacterium]